MQRGNISKYKPYSPVPLTNRQWPSRIISQAPSWASVDLRDGNQALATPMSVEEKLELFELLVSIGFKEIEVGFPAAANTEFEFCRRLIEEKRIPDDVRIQILTQAREPLIKKSFEALKGAKKVCIHLYNSTSPLQRKITFSDASKEDIKTIAVQGTQIIKELLPTLDGTDVQFQYSPESFSDTETEYALEVCEAVMDVWQPTEEAPLVLNLPATVEWFSPNVHADQIEWFCKQLEAKGRRKQVIISLHTHNDRGTGTAATELGLLAGADRVEGTLFGNGERTGNLDIVIVALNLYIQGVDPELDFSNIPHIREVYERTTRMTVHERHPYAGELVFTAFSGSHQDAIKKGMDRRPTEDTANAFWQVPYLTIDPNDIGRTYEAIIRINSQSGKGGVAYILQKEAGLDLPKTMHPEIGSKVYELADKQGKELSLEEIKIAFDTEYLDRKTPLELHSYTLFTSKENEHNIELEAEVTYQDKKQIIRGQGNGPINALVHAIESQGWKHFKLLDYRSHSIGGGSDTKSAAYIQLKRNTDGKTFWGCGIHTNIEMAGLKALISAYNRSA